MDSVGIYNYIQDLEQQVEGQNELIDLVAPSIEWQEAHLSAMTSTRRGEMEQIVRAYRVLRPKKEESAE